MNIVVNGKNVEVTDNVLTISVLIKQLDLPEMGIAIAVGSSVIPKIKWSEFQIEENAVVTIIRATQGG